MTKKQLTKLNEIYDLESKNTCENLQKKIDNFFKEHFKTHKRSPDGVLLFQANLDVIENTSLSELKRNECCILMHNYDIPRSTLYKLKKKEDLKKIIRDFIKKKYPNHPTNEERDYIFNQTQP